MELGFRHKAWEKWASHNIGSSSEPLKAAMLLNYDYNLVLLLLSIIAEQRGIIGKPVELVSFLDYVKRNNLPGECFVIGSNQYKNHGVILLPEGIIESIPEVMRLFLGKKGRYKGKEVQCYLPLLWLSGSRVFAIKI
ncbi:hypothetical protein IFM89_035330 [Coptis chinensis]|uniref:Uncharacterized protein n=1 Tax=Coptis chinensis TaxID=261450 RepID=A0A835HPZ2_9MAGN|nr:hypothetical protein IFM89_035330 [Coptis chinensis]